MRIAPYICPHLSKAAIVLAGLVVVACVAVPNYPPDWSPVVKIEAERCPLIEGRYANDDGVVSRCNPPGELTPVGWKCGFNSVLSSNLLAAHPDEWYKGDDYPFIEIKQPDQDTVVISFGEGRVPTVFKRSKGDFTCDEGGLTILGQSRWLEHGWVVQQLSRSFQRARDGSLVMRAADSGFAVGAIGGPGAAIPIPLAVSGTIYVRWAATPREPERESTSVRENLSPAAKP